MSRFEFSEAAARRELGRAILGFAVAIALPWGAFVRGMPHKYRSDLVGILVITTPLEGLLLFMIVVYVRRQLRGGPVPKRILGIGEHALTYQELSVAWENVERAWVQGRVIVLRTLSAGSRAKVVIPRSGLSPGQEKEIFSELATRLGTRFGEPPSEEAARQSVRVMGMGCGVFLMLGGAIFTCLGVFIVVTLVMSNRPPQSWQVLVVASGMAAGVAVALYGSSLFRRARTDSVVITTTRYR